MDSISSGKGSMAATFTLYTRCINDLNFPTSINLVLVLLSSFSLFCVHLSPPLVASFVGFFALWLILHRSVGGLENYIPLQRNAAYDSGIYSSVKHAPFFVFPPELSIALVFPMVPVVFWDVWTLRRPAALTCWQYEQGPGRCAPWRIDLRWTGDERGDVERRHHRLLIKLDWTKSKMKGCEIISGKNGLPVWMQLHFHIVDVVKVTGHLPDWATTSRASMFQFRAKDANVRNPSTLK